MEIRRQENTNNNKGDMMSKGKQCDSKIKFANRIGKCELETGHVGAHQEAGFLKDKMYILQWKETKDVERFREDCKTRSI